MVFVKKSNFFSILKARFIFLSEIIKKKGLMREFNGKTNARKKTYFSLFIFKLINFDKMPEKCFFIQIFEIIEFYLKMKEKLKKEDL